MQQRRKEYIMQKKREAMLRTCEESGLTAMGSIGRIKYKPVKSMFEPPKTRQTRKGQQLCTEQEISNARVPKDLQKWIYRPEIASKFEK